MTLSKEALPDELENIIFEHVLEKDQDPGFLSEDATYTRFSELNGRIPVTNGKRQIPSREAIIQHMVTVMKQYYTILAPVTFDKNHIAKVDDEDKILANSWKKMGAILYRAQFQKDFRVEAWCGFERDPEFISAKLIVAAARAIRPKLE